MRHQQHNIAQVHTHLAERGQWRMRRLNAVATRSVTHPREHFCFAPLLPAPCFSVGKARGLLFDFGMGPVFFFVKVTYVASTESELHLLMFTFFYFFTVDCISP